MAPPPATLPPSDAAPRLCVLVDVEEEFDWSLPFDPRRRGVSHLRRLPDLLELLSARGLAPVGVCSYPVVEDPTAVELIGEELGAGRMVLGTHLHPWVCPPEFDVSDHTSFPGNLPREVERAKLATLTGALHEAFGQRPRIYQAGRYGLGPSSHELLTDLDYLVDMSTSPPFDYRPDGGPDYRHAVTTPSWVSERGPLLSLPVTGAFVGRLATLGPALHPLASGPLLRALRLPAVLSRSGLLERLRLSPEGHDTSDMLRLARYLLAHDVRVLVMSLHSPSLEPGHTPYVNSDAERRDFLDRIARFIDAFVEQLGGRVCTPLELHAELLEQRPGDAVAP